MNIINLERKIKSQLIIDYMNAVYKVSDATHPNEYLYKIKQYKRARYLKRLLEERTQTSQCPLMV